MDQIKSDMEGGFNTLIADQKKEPGTCTVGLSQFDDYFETVYVSLPLRDVPELTLVPRGLTALIDAACQSIDALGARLATMAEKNRPERVIYVMITDGLENKSRRFRNEHMKERITRQTEQYAWSFIYLGANQDAVAVAHDYGIPMAGAITYDADHDGTHAVYAAASSSVSSIRGGNLQDAGFTSAQRKAASKTTKNPPLK